MQLRVHAHGFYFKVMGSHGWSLNNKRVCNNFECVCVCVCVCVWRGGGYGEIRSFESSQEATQVKKEASLTKVPEVDKEWKNQIKEMRRQNQQSWATDST